MTNQQTTEALKEWEAAARRVKGMFREFGWPERLTFTEAVAEQLVLMTYLPDTTAQEPSAPIAPVVDESAWLLEKMHGGNVQYISADYVLQWTDDPNKALRLARREDAEALCTIVEDCEKIAEHGWPAPASTVAPQEQKCEHGIPWSMECLSCGHSDYGPAAIRDEDA